MIDAAEKAEETSAAILQYAVKEGRQEGLTEGIVIGRAEGLTEGDGQGRTEVARNLLRDGVPVGQVAKYTELPIADIEKLHHSYRRRARDQQYVAVSTAAGKYAI